MGRYYHPLVLGSRGQYLEIWKLVYDDFPGVSATNLKPTLSLWILNGTDGRPGSPFTLLQPAKNVTWQGADKGEANSPSRAKFAIVTVSWRYCLGKIDLSCEI
jgi:hypothetical protein